jgi:glycosyltransferase involved in cell wall biosynthesis
MMQREQHLMLGLSRVYRILFVDPPLSFLTVPLGRIQGKRWGFGGGLRRVNDHLIVYSPPAFLPFGQRSPAILRINRALLLSLIKGQIEKLSFKNFILGLAWPLWGEVIGALGARLSYYDCSDDYLAFPRLRASRAMLQRSEEQLLRSVDLVFCSSQGLREAKSGFNKNCFLVPNGVDLRLFENGREEKRSPPDLNGIKRPLLGYIGTMGEWFDLDTLIDLARARTDWSIVLIGPMTSRRIASTLAGVPNIYWLGEKGYPEIPAYLKAFDLCLIPFKISDFTAKIYPTKFHEYLAAGKPVVSSPLPDLIAFKPWAEFYGDSKEMETKVERLLKEDSREKALQRARVAGENTWERRVESIVRILNTFVAEETRPA